MDQEIAKLAITFLRRVELRGHEVEAYAAVFTSLTKIIESDNTPIVEGDEKVGGSNHDKSKGTVID